VVEVVERDDGCVFTGEPAWYLAPFRAWWSQERRAMRFVRGRVLDLGCGAGRVGLHLQSRGHEVVGIDVSPLAVEIARQRGLADVRLGTFDSAVGVDERFERNRKRGRMAGVERLRVRYRQYATPWYDVLFASREEVAWLAQGTGWVTRRFVDDGAGYVAVLEPGPAAKYA
jgi:hypothetical protein